MSRETKKVTDEWNSKITDCDAYTYTYNLEEILKSIDNKLMDIENNLNNSDFGGIGYESQYSTIEDIIDKMITINDFVDELPNHMQKIDSDYCRDVQNGSVYELSRIKLEDFETRKVGSLSSSYRDHKNVYSTEAISLNFADFLGISGNENDYEEDYAYADGTINDYFVRSFANIFQQQYNEEVDAGSTDTLYSYLNGEMTAGEFVQKRQHSIFLKAFSDVVDIIPIAGQAKMLYEMASGKEAFTGDELTFSEMRNATIFTAVSVLAMPEGLSGISSKFFDGAVVDIEKGIGSETLDELNKVVVDDYDGSPIIGRLEGGSSSAYSSKDWYDYLNETYGKDNVEWSSGEINGIKAKNIEVINAETANANWAKMGYTEPPYKAGADVYTFDVCDETEFVRVYSYNADGSSNKLGGWLMRKKDIEGLSASEIADKYALPQLPTHICDVLVPKDFSLEVGEANGLKGWGNGGGTQFDTMGKFIDEDAFVNERLIGE